MERLNRTLLSMLATAATDHPFDWEKHLHRLCMAYNTSVHPTTGQTPLFLMYGLQVRMPVDLMYGMPSPNLATVTEYTTHLRDSLEDAYQQVRERMGRRLKREKELYDRKVHGEPFEAGNLVWLHCPAVPRGQC